MQAKVDALPTPTKDLDRIQLDLAEHGIALLDSALAEERVSHLSRVLMAQAERERQQGGAFLEDGNLGQLGSGPNQRVFGLIGKGAEFRELATDHRALDVVRRVFGSSYPLPPQMIEHAALDDVLLSSLTANIVGSGGVEMMKHADQAFMPPSTPYPAVLNVIWLLTDFNPTNGATLVAPGTHLADDPQRFYVEPPPMRAIEAPAGTAVFLDGRTWHATGVNRMDDKRTAIFAYYCRPFIRQQENFALSLRSHDVAAMDEELRALLGFKVWFTLGSVEGAPNGALVRS